MTKELKEKILEMVRPYPFDNDSTAKEAGYLEAIGEVIKAFDAIIASEVEKG